MESKDSIIEPTQDLSGYSEQKLAKNTELQAGQWLDLKKGDSNKTTSQSKKLSSTKSQSVQKSSSKNNYSDKIEQLILQLSNSGNNLISQFLKVYKNDVSVSDDIYKQILDNQRLQKSLLSALNYYIKGELDVKKLPKQVQSLLE